MSCPARFPLFGAILLIALLATGCSRQTETPPPAQSHPLLSDLQPVQGDWVVERIDSDLDTLNPLTCVTDNSQWLTSSIINEGLLQMDSFTLKLEPCLAESWEISPDQFTYTFHLRHGVKWHDGEPFTADDVKYTYDRLMDPKVNAAPLRSYFTNIKSCEVLDPYTVRFVATQRYFKTLEVLGTYMPIVPKHILEKGEPDFNKHPFGRHPIGTGPYKFVRWDTGSQIVVERNDDYWDKSRPIYPKRIVFQVLEEPYVAAQLLKKGDIDVFDRVAPIQWERDLKDSHAMRHLHEMTYDFPAYSYFGFNLRNPMFSDIRVRHAIDLLMPRDEIIARVYLNQYATKTSGYDPPSEGSYNHDVPPTPYDPALAMQLLDQAGWKNDHGDGLLYKDGNPLSFTLSYPAGNPISQKVAELIQESLAKAGIKLDLQHYEFAELCERIDDWKFDAVLAGWGLDINGDPAQLWDSSGADVKKSSNSLGYKNPEADKLIAEGKLEYDDNKRAAIYRQLHKIIHDDYPCCFLFNPREIIIVSDRFQNVRFFAPRPCFDLTTWWVPRYLQKYQN
ncbi:MAG TPA: peptide-binding protein [Candidatus Methylacidiphilales bacterium]|nr:peptide-binding protein [Candidatus Methylacidiphilales bacterium]